MQHKIISRRELIKAGAASVFVSSLAACATMGEK